MPLYEYACRACGHHFEVQQRFSEDPIKACPQCGSEVRRVIFPVGVVFKGSGFYKTDNRGTATKDTDREQVSTGGDSSPSSDGKTSGESKTDSSKAEPAASTASAPASSGD